MGSSTITFNKGGKVVTTTFEEEVRKVWSLRGAIIPSYSTVSSFSRVKDKTETLSCHMLIPFINSD